MNTYRTIPLGYCIREGKVEIDPQTAPMAMEMFRAYCDGSSYQAIADRLTIQGIPMRSNKPAWDKHMVRRLLENTKYVGKAGYPRMISDALFAQAAQHRGERNNTVPKEGTAALLARLTYCKHCGKKVLRDSKNLRYTKWYCTCHTPKQRKTVRDNQVIEETAALLEWIRKDPTRAQPVFEQGERKKNALKQAQTNLETGLSRQADANWLQDAILRLAQQTYAALPDPPSPETLRIEHLFEAIEEPIVDLDEKMVQQTIRRIEMDSNGQIRLTLINGTII